MSGANLKHSRPWKIELTHCRLLHDNFATGQRNVVSRTDHYSLVKLWICAGVIKEGLQNWIISRNFQEMYSYNHNKPPVGLCMK